MPLVAPGVCRYAWHGRIGSTDPWTVIMDMRVDTTGTLTERSDALYQCAGNMINAWVDHIIPEMSTFTYLDSISWVDLDDEYGTTGERSVTSEHTLPAQGGRSGYDFLPANCAILVTKVVTRQRGFRKGRMYMPGGSEAMHAGSLLTAAAKADWDAAMPDFLSMLKVTEASPFDYQAYPTVVHTETVLVDGEKVQQYVGHTDVLELVVNQRLATQRRRMR